MARPEKVAVVDEVKDRFTAATATVLTEYRGLTVAELAQLRAELRKSEAEYKVAKNTLVRIAAKEAGMGIPDELLSGPTAITFCAGDPVAVAKVLRTFSKAHPALVVKGGILEGKLLDAAETLRLADLESREELLSRLAGMMMTIVAQPARLAHASLSKMARLLAAYQGKREEAGETPEPDSPAAEAVTEEAKEVAADATPEGKVTEEPHAAQDALPEADAPAAATEGTEEAAAEEPADAEPSDSSEAPEAAAETETGETVPAADVPEASTTDEADAEDTQNKE